MKTLTRRSFVKRSSVAGGGLIAAGPLGALSARATAAGGSAGYGPLVDKGDLWLPAAFAYAVVSRQGEPMSDGNPTPGIFDGMGAYPGDHGTTVLIRNHENRERAGEQKVVTPPSLQYNPAAFGGNTKLVVDRRRDGVDPATGEDRYAYEVVEQFAILGGTSTNCAGGLRGSHTWITCEEVVKRLNGRKHGYIFEIDARANGPVAAIPVPQAGRRAHEAAVERAGVIYMTEDRSISSDAQLGQVGACLYRYTPDRPSAPLHETSGPLEALKIRGEFHANMDTGREVGKPYPVEWVPVAQPDHDDDTDNRRDRVPGLTPNRVAAQDMGAAYFDRQEGMWVGPGNGGKIYFDCTTGGAAGLGQVWEYDAGRETLTLIYESTDAARLENPDNVVIVPQTNDVLLQEDSDGDQFIRGVTRDGRIYDFAKSGSNDSEFCGACFSPDGRTLFVNQQGQRGSLPDGPAGGQAVTYAIYGPFERRADARGR